MSDKALPTALLTHFRNLCADAFTAGWTELAKRGEELRDREAARGWPIPTGSYFGRLLDAYIAEMRRRGEIIVATIKDVHAAFGTPLDSGVDEQFVRLASETFAAQSRALQAAFDREISRTGAQRPTDSDRSLKMRLHQAAQSAAVPSGVRRYLWELRNVPRATASPPAPHGAPVINVANLYGVVQTGANAVASVNQQWNEAVAADLARAIDRLREAIESASEIADEDRLDLQEDLQMARAEVCAPAPRASKILRWLSGVGGVVQTLGSAREAWQVVQATARAAGVPLP
jgi:hypothetical protein